MFSQKSTNVLYCLALCLLARSGYSNENEQIYAGDSVVVVAEQASLGIRDQSSVSLPQGTRVEVTEVRGQWIGGTAIVQGEKHTGWVYRTEVALVGLSPAETEPIRVPEKPDDPAAVAAITSLGVVVEKNADGYTITADAADKPVTDAAMANFAKMYHLSSLQLCGCEIGDAAVKQLVPLIGLQELYLDDTGVTDAGLAYIARLPNLEVLTLSGTKVDGRGLDKLQSLHNLRVLNLSRCQIEDTSLSPLGRLAKLEVLALANTRITGRGLASLTTLTRLRVVNLNGTAIDAAALEHLKSLDRLRMLYIRETPITGIDAAALTDANPCLAVYTE